MESISSSHEEASKAGSNSVIENIQKDAQKYKNQKLSSVALKQQKKIQKQLVGENMERMNYLYQCASLVAKLTRDQPKPLVPQLDASLTSLANESTKLCEVASENKSSDRLSSVPASTGSYDSVTTSSVNKVSTFQTYSQCDSSTICCLPRTQPSSKAGTPSSNSTVSSPVLPLQLLASVSSVNTPSSERPTVLTSSPSRSMSLDKVPFFHPEISSNLGSTCRAIGRKCQLRMSHIMKRELCPSCYTHLVPSVTASAKIIRVRKKRVLVLTCHTCGGRRKRPCQDVKVLWTEQPESRFQPTH